MINEIIQINIVVDWIATPPSKINIANLFALNRSLLFGVSSHAHSDYANLISRYKGECAVVTVVLSLVAKFNEIANMLVNR